MKVLLAVDGSKNSLDAVDCLIEHADWYRDKPSVELVTVHLPLPQFRGLKRVIGQRDINRYYEEEGQARLVKAAAKLEKAGIPFYRRVLVGPIAETLEKHSRDFRCDMILLATRGMSATANALVGSTATKLLHIARIPVLLVK